jgi:uncharacterized protein (TIGR03083 family)
LLDTNRAFMMAGEGVVMLEQLYLDQQERIIAMLADAGGDEPVPACPGWSTGDVVRHLTGLAEDWISHDLDGYAGAEWTERQVDRHRARSVDDVIDRWRSSGATLASYLDDMGNHGLPETVTTTIGPSPVKTFGLGILIDLSQHVHDIAEAVGATTDDGDVIKLCNRALTRGAHAAVKRSGTAPIRLSTTEDGEIATLGAGEHELSLTTDRLSLFRSMGGRRTLDQIRALDWHPKPHERPELLVSPFFRAPAA